MADSIPGSRPALIGLSRAEADELARSLGLLHGVDVFVLKGPLPWDGWIVQLVLPWGETVTLYYWLAEKPAQPEADI